MENEQEMKFYSVAEVSEILGISRSMTYEWVASPQCPFLVIRIGRRVDKGKCEEWEKKGKRNKWKIDSYAVNYMFRDAYGLETRMVLYY